MDPTEENAVHKQFQQLLHQYKIDVFHAEHNKESVEDIIDQTLHITEEVLERKYHYHFHKLPDANRAEIINMINNYTREAILPPVVERIVMRQVKLERRFEALLALTQELLEVLSTDPGAARAEKAAS
jgi:hypothetical protein